ncbi:uncharacterized protein METZ01_LOCUS461216 [marine metagenome]|uniref:Sulphur transport domain-containing protein n=1 Tax=marine metagenome TaxID=408172 RepID=A0A383AKS5_9ZZZZ
MTNPDKVIGFLDIFYSWDPSLGFVMAGAIIITSPILYFLTKNNSIILAEKISLPTKKNIDKPLIIGSLVFGIGWGMAGLCPGPSISSLAFLNFSSFAFVFSMFFGLFIGKFIKL